MLRAFQDCRAGFAGRDTQVVGYRGLPSLRILLRKDSGRVDAGQTVSVAIRPLNPLYRPETPLLRSLRRLDRPDCVRHGGGGREQVRRALDHGETRIGQIAIGGQ